MKLPFNRLRGLTGKASGHRLRKCRKQSLALLAQSDLFDRKWYLHAYPDVRDSGVDPVGHYLDSGWREGRDPGPDFCTTAYLKGNSDVAALGVNPLLHYIEHGRFEGRGAVHHGAPFRATFSPDERFGLAAPCPAFPVRPAASARWSRAGRIEGHDAPTASLGGLTVARFGDRDARRLFDCGLQLLAWISGRKDEVPKGTSLSAGIHLGLHDTWHAGSGIFRTRWSPSDRPVVVRAIQHIGAEPVLVGEGCVAHDLDFVDVRPLNPHFPLLFTFMGAEGDFVGHLLLAFPALCRGGIHYPELVAISEDGREGSIDVAAVDAHLATKLIDLRLASSPPTVAGLTVNLDGADGTHSLFQRDYRDWLASVMRVGVVAVGGTDGDARDYLLSALGVEATPDRLSGVATLALASDMVPALSALVMAEEGPAREDMAGSFIATSSGGSTATWIDIPSSTPSAEFGEDRSMLPILSPRNAERGIPEALPVLAIRLASKRAITDSELLVPRPDREPSRDDGLASITWLLWPEQWKEQDLARSLEALLWQTSGVPAVIFIGPVSKTAAAFAQKILGPRLRTATSLGEAASMIDTSLAGYLGPGIILHDRRTVALLAETLRSTAAITATALIVSAEKRGKGSEVVPDDPQATAAARFLPGAMVPLPMASTDFWISHAERLRDLIAEPADKAAGSHVCSTQITVSRLSRMTAKPPIALAPGTQNRAISSKILVG